MADTKIVRIYVSQHLRWWMFTPREWRDWLIEMLPKIRNGEGYTLPDGKMLKGSPSTYKVGRFDWNSSRLWYPNQPGIRVVKPLGWTLEEWEREAAINGMGEGLV